MSDQNAGLTYKGRPLMRKDNMIYYGSMADSHIVMLQVLESKKVNGLDVATRVSVQLLLNDPNLKSRERIVKKSEKGYNPINQIVGYLLTEDPTYITNYNNARSMICKLDRDELLQELVQCYLFDKQ